MKHLVLAAAVLIAALGILTSPHLLAARADTSLERGRPGGPGFERFLQRYEAANTAFVNGDPEPWMELTANNDPASIFGGFGGTGESGVAEVRERYRLAGTAFRPSNAVVDFDYLVKDVRKELAYTVAVERSHVIFAGQTEARPQVLRVTMIFRLEQGRWRIVHRHADTMIELQLPRGER